MSEIIHRPHTGHIVRCSAGNTYRVTDSTTYDHAYIAVPVRRVKGGYVDKTNAKARLIRSLGTTVVEG